MVWVKWFTAVRNVVNASTSILQATTEPTVDTDTAEIWCASGAGTKDGVAYDQGDVLVTINVGGVSKTKLLADYSTL